METDGRDVSSLGQLELQWGHVQVNVETRAQELCSEIASLPASMGPRSGERGNFAFFRKLSDGRERASMGPRSGERGNSSG